MKIILIHKQIIKITANLKLKLKLNNKLLYYQIEKNKLINQLMTAELDFCKVIKLKGNIMLQKLWFYKKINNNNFSKISIQMISKNSFKILIN